MTARRGQAILMALGVGLLCSPVVQGQSQLPPGAVHPLAQALEEARRQPAVRRLLLVEAEGRLAEGITGVLLFGDGVGVLNGKRQFQASDQLLVAVLDLLIARGVAAWPEESPFPGNALEIHLRLLVRVGEASHQVLERNRRPPRPPLRELLRDLAELVRPAAASGVEVSSLEEGLRLLAQGQLAPHLLTVNALAPSIPGTAAGAPEGWQLSLHRGVLEASEYSFPGGVRSLARRPALDEVASLAQLLVEAKAASLPRQIHLEEGFFQLHLEVLNQRLSIQARPFAGKGAAQGVAGRDRLLALREQLRARFAGEAQRARGGSTGST